MENKTIKIVSAHQLSKVQQAKLEKSVITNHGENLDFVYEIDESVIGGFKIVDGYDVFDATVLSKVISIKKQIK
ncbi:MAG: F0F1 ATP synthase subunit delta [Bacillota bacterium]